MDCPETHIVSCNPIVTFDLPHATSECGPVPVIQTDYTGLTSGSEFPEGTTTLTFRASNATSSANCSIDIEVLPKLDIQHNSGVQYGDTLHIEQCSPPDISKTDLDLGLHQQRSSLAAHIYTESLPSHSKSGLWKFSLYSYDVKDQCGNSEHFENYVALYDLDPPVFLNFPGDIIIDTPANLPPVPNDVRILDICRYVVWDTVTTEPILDPQTTDTLAFVRRWMAEDEVGNKSFRDQMIYVRSTPNPDLNNITAHIIKKADLLMERFPNTAGTDSIPVTLYRQNIINGSFIPIDTLLSGNWMGRRGNLFFSSLHPGNYKLKIQLPRGYTALHPDSQVYENGWSDTLKLNGNSKLIIGTILLVPGMVKDTIPAFPGIEDPISSVALRSTDFTVYPNPTSGMIKIDIPYEARFNYSIFTHLGQTVKKGRIENGSEIDLHNQADGMYFIRVEKDHVISVTKPVLLISN